MGKTCGKPIVIEFNGIPGAGKTTAMYEIKKILREKKIKEIQYQKIRSQRVSYKEILLSKDLRKAYMIFLRILLLVRPLTRERWKYMKITFRDWYGVRKLGMEPIRQKEVCILDQGIIQGFVSIAYQGVIRNEEKYCKYIGQLMEFFDYVVCINCNVDIEIAQKRMRTRRLATGRLDRIKSDRELRETLQLQKRQFEKIRRISINNGLDINMQEDAKHNAERVVEFCV